MSLTPKPTNQQTVQEDVAGRVQRLEATSPPPPFTGIEVMDDHGDDFTDVESVEFIANDWAFVDVSQTRGPGTADVTINVRKPGTEFLEGAAYDSSYAGSLPFAHDFGSTLLGLTSPQVPTYSTDHDTLASVGLSVINADGSLTPGDIVELQAVLFRPGPVFYADSGPQYVEVQASGKFGWTWATGDIVLDEGPGPSGYVYTLQVAVDTLPHASHLVINRATFTAI